MFIVNGKSHCCNDLHCCKQRIFKKNTIIAIIGARKQKRLFFSEHSNVIGNFIIYTLQHQTRFMAIFL